MARLPRLFIPGQPQLLLQRGNNRALIFLDETDQVQYSQFLREAVRETGVSLHAYVLMPDHVHLLLTAPAAEAPGQLMQRLGRRYVRWFNDRYGRSGTLWEGRYRSTVVDALNWLPVVCRYIELNPVRAGLVVQPAQYPWSSCAHHLGMTRDVLINDHAFYWALGNTPFERQAAYRAGLENGVPEHHLAAIRYAAHRGWMLGDLSGGQESAPNRRASPLPKGRPRKLPDGDKEKALM